MYNNIIDNNLPRMIEWQSDLGENFEHTKKAIITILKDQKVSLSKTRCLFFNILDEIEDKNPINY